MPVASIYGKPIYRYDSRMPDSKPLCFAIMPITTPHELLQQYGHDSQHFIRVARHIFKPAAEAAGFEFRAPTTTSAEIVQADIIKNLEQADLVLCDISTWNANVFFELGIRVALDRSVAMVKDQMTERIPFDNAMINCHQYDGRMDVYVVEDEVPKLKTFLDTAKTQDQNALWKYFGITQRAARKDAGSSGDAMLELILAELSALRRASDSTSSLRQAAMLDLSTMLASTDARGRNADLRLLPVGTLEVTTSEQLPPSAINAFNMLAKGYPYVTISAIYYYSRGTTTGEYAIEILRPESYITPP